MIDSFLFVKCAKISVMHGNNICAVTKSKTSERMFIFPKFLH